VVIEGITLKVIPAAITAAKILFILFLISKNPPCQDLKFCIKKHARIGGARDFGLYVILITSVHIVIYFQGVIAVNSGGGIE
jgi:hypothetical protein